MLYAMIFLQRLAETVTSMLPSLLSGTVLAGVVAAFVPAATIRRLMGTRPDGVSAGIAWSPALGAVWGLLLPVCAMGILPVLFVARRAGASRRSLAALAVCGGTVHPYTLVYAMGLSAPWKLAVVVGGIALTAVLAGLAAGDRAPRPPVADLPPSGKLLGAALISGHLVLRLLPVYALISVVVAAVAATLVPPGYIGHLFAESEPAHVLIGLGLALPAYAPPSIAALQVTEILWQRTDPGLAAGWWVLAGGLSAGTLLFLPRVLGWAGLVRAGLTVVVLLTGLAFALSPVLRDGPVPEGDSHAFDRHNQPYHHAVTQHGHWTWLGKQLGELNTLEVHLCLLGFLLLGLTAGLPTAVQSRILTPAGAQGHLPAPVVTAVLTLAAAAVLASLLYTHFPAPGRLFDEARHPDAELLSLLPTGKWEALDDPLRQLSDKVNRLGPAARLRSTTLPPGFDDALGEARSHLSALMDAIDRRDAPAATERSIALTRSLRAAERAWRGAPARTPE